MLTLFIVSGVGVILLGILDWGSINFPRGRESLPGYVSLFPQSTVCRIHPVIDGVGVGNKFIVGAYRIALRHSPVDIRPFC